MAEFRMKDASPERVKNEIYSYSFKLSLYGCASVGKTAAMVKFTEDRFEPRYISTIGIDFVLKTVEISGGDLVKLQIWDTSGHERFRMVTQSYFRRGAHGIILFFDVTNRKTFETLPRWIEDLRQDSNEDLEIILAGTKSDLEDQRAVSIEEISALANEQALDFIEISAKTGNTVSKLFGMIVAKMVYANNTKTSNSSHTTSLPVAGNSTIHEGNSDGPKGAQSNGNGTCVFL